MLDLIKNTVMQKAMRLRVCCPVVHSMLREQLHPQIRKFLPSQMHRRLSVRTQAVQQQTEVQQERRHAEKQSSTGNGAPAPQTHLTFQEAISTLEQYWAKQSGLNCAILLPHNTEVRGVVWLSIMVNAGMPHGPGCSMEGGCCSVLLLDSVYKDSCTLHPARSTQLHLAGRLSACRWELAL